MKYQMFLLALVTLLIYSCDDNNVLEPIIDEPGDEILKDNVLLQNLAVGQKSYFIQYQSTCEDMDSKFEYTGDTMVWEVILREGKKMLKEELTPLSTGRLNNPGYEPTIYPVEEIDNALLLKDRWASSLFYFYGNDTLRLKHPMDVELQQQNCLMITPSDIFRGDEVGHIKSFRIGDMEIQDKTVVSCVPMIDIDAYIIYTDNHLYASHTVTTSEFNGQVATFINGWQLLR